jgi:hypothetical protein
MSKSAAGLRRYRLRGFKVAIDSKKHHPIDLTMRYTVR